MSDSSVHGPGCCAMVVTGRFHGPVVVVEAGPRAGWCWLLFGLLGG